MISIKNLSKKYNSEGKEISALKNVNLNIKKGEIFGIIGPSGAGKSTLIRNINLLERPSSGEIKFKDKKLENLSSIELRNKRQKIGMIFQHFNLLKSRTVEGNVLFPLEIAGVNKEEAKKRVKRLLELVGLSDKSANFPANLSGGQKQRVGIARALANDPELLLSDEATSSLDPDSTAEILELLSQIRDKLDLTIILITHEMEVIKEICDRVAVIKDGEIVEKGSVIELFSKPVEDITKSFVKNIMDYKLPQMVLEHFNNNNRGEIVRVNFLGQSTQKPLISNLIKKYDIDANILYGNIDEIQSTPFGTLVIKLEGNKEEIEKSIKYLRGYDLIVEVLGDDRIN